MSEIDQTIINGCKAGKRGSQEQLFKLLYSPIFKTCMLYSSSRMQAEDFAHDGFIKIFQKVNQYNGTGSFEGWARRVVRNIIFDDLKNSKKFNFVDGDEIVDIPESEPELIDNYKGISTEKMLSILQGLPTCFRTVFNLKVFDDMTHEEIGKTLGISDGTSKSHYHRAKNKILKAFNEEVCKI